MCHNPVPRSHAASTVTCVTTQQSRNEYRRLHPLTLNHRRESHVCEKSRTLRWSSAQSLRDVFLGVSTQQRKLGKRIQIGIIPLRIGQCSTERSDPVRQRMKDTSSRSLARAAGGRRQLPRGSRIGCLTRAVSFRFGGGRWRLLRWSRAVWLRCIFEAAAPSHHRDHPG